MGTGHDHNINNDTTFEKETRMEDRKLHLSHFMGKKYGSNQDQGCHKTQRFLGKP